MKNLQRFEIKKKLIAVTFSLAVALICILFLADNPMIAIQSFLLGPISSISRLGNVVEMMIPLTFTGLAVSVMFRANQINMGSEGIFFISAVFASYLAINLRIPRHLHAIVVLVLSMLLGGILNLIPAYLKVKFKSSELVSSLMLNYIWLFLGLYIVNYHIRDTSAGDLASLKFQESAKLTNVIPGTRIHMGLIIALLLSVGLYIMIFKTKLGYKIRLTGNNEEFAKYSGINVLKIILISQLVGGMLAGLGGATEVLGMYSRFKWKTSPNYGFDGIIIASLAGNNPLFVPIAAFLISYLRIGSDVMGIYSNIPSELIVMIQALIIILVVAKNFMAKSKRKLVIEAANQEGGAS